MYLLGLYHELRQQRFPIYLSRPTLLLCLPSSYYSQRFTRTAAVHRGHLHNTQTSTHT